MKTKTFKDGDRLVFVIEGCDEETRKTLYTLLKPEVMGDLEASPTSFFTMIKDKDLDELESNGLGSETDKIFKKVAQMYREGSKPESDRKVRLILNKYVGRRFLGKDPKKMANLLNDGHCQTFVDTFDFALEKQWQETDMVKENFSSYDLEHKQAFVAKAIDLFIGVGKKFGY